MKTATKPTFRTDLYAVKADQRDGVGWCFVAICKDRSEAIARARSIRNDHSIGLNRRAKVVHPAQWVVDGFIAAGNQIQ